MKFLILLLVLSVFTKIQYCSIVNYSPRGDSEISIKSRNLRGGIKAGRIDHIEYVVNQLKNYMKEDNNLSSFFNEDVTLVPVPKSAPLVQDAIWPSHIISAVLFNSNIAGDISTLIKRIKAVPKSSFQSSSEFRPSVQEHYDSLNVTPDLILPHQITLIDDALTLGRTSFACAQKLHEEYPKIEIKVFAILRTQGLIPNINSLIDLSFGSISFNERTGKTTRND